MGHLGPDPMRTCGSAVNRDSSWYAGVPRGSLRTSKGATELSYLIIMALLAAAAIARLWLQQRKVHSHQETVDGFQMALTKISEPNPIVRTPRRAAPSPSADRSRPRRERQPLDPARREAAKRRLEARRRARAGSTV